jgi:hypothetical protein
MCALEVSTGLTAIIAVWIAYRQYHNDRVRVTMELYEKRFAIYKAFTDLLDAISCEATANEDQIRTYSQKTRDSYFLFGPEVGEYIEHIFKQAWELRCQDKKIHGPHGPPVGPEREALCHTNVELLKWFNRHAEVGRRKFRKYLALY